MTADPRLTTRPSHLSLHRPRVDARLRRAIVSFTALIVVWQVSAWLSGLSSFFYPRPTDVLAAFGTLIGTGILPQYLTDSLVRWAVGVTLGFSAAVLALVLMTISSLVRQALMPIVSFFHAIAELAWLPLFVLWFGFSFQTVVFTIGYVVFFPVLYNAIIGIRAVPPASVNAVRTLGANRRQVIWHVLLPGALPNMLTGLRIGAGYAFRALIASEIIAADSGIGFMIFQAREYQLTDRVVAGMIVMGVLWLIIEYCFLRPVEQATIERWGMVQDASDAS